MWRYLKHVLNASRSHTVVYEWGSVIMHRMCLNGNWHVDWHIGQNVINANVNDSTWIVGKQIDYAKVM